MNCKITIAASTFKSVELLEWWNMCALSKNQIRSASYQFHS